MKYINNSEYINENENNNIINEIIEDEEEEEENDEEEILENEDKVKYMTNIQNIDDYFEYIKNVNKTEGNKKNKNYSMKMI